jgi:hypothetical protein
VRGNERLGRGVSESFFRSWVDCVNGWKLGGGGGGGGGSQKKIYQRNPKKISNKPIDQQRKCPK